MAFAVAGGVAGHAVFESWVLGVGIALVVFASRLLPSGRAVAWRHGAEGEALVGRALDAVGSDRAVTLHDRLIPRSRANIDHLAVTPSGVWTVAAKNYQGCVEVRARNRQLWVGGRNRSKLLDQAEYEAAVVRHILEDAGHGEVPVKPVLCFVGAEWPLMFHPKTARGVRLTSARDVGRVVTSGERVLGQAQMRQIAAVLDRALLPAGRVVVDPGAATFGPTPAASPPTCDCGNPMTLRHRSRDGEPFWGCSTFPDCRRTRPV